MPISSSTFRWTFTALVAASLLFVWIMVNGKPGEIPWKPFLIFILINWLFADGIFRYIPTGISIKKRFIPVEWIVDMALGAIAAVFVFSLSPRYLFDDAGYVLRYVENFRHGYFYRFNPQDQPVFGLSGFIHGILCFLLSLTGISSPATLKLVNLIGSATYVFILIRICRKLIPDKRLVWMAAILLALGIDNVILMFASGLEMPVHIAIVAATILFFLHNQHKWFYIFCALSVISKLDATPLVAVMLGLHVWEHIILPGAWRQVKLPLLYGGVPLVIWVLFSWGWFGSPLPQSAFAKYYYHPNADPHFFPFLHYFITHPSHRITFPAFEIISILHLADVIYYRKYASVKRYVFGGMFWASMALFYFYNPNERMIWYYSLPDFLMLAQVIFGFIYFATKKPLVKFPAIAAIPLMALGLVIFQNASNSLQYHSFYTERVERERFRIGEYMHHISTPTDTLASSHGLFGWKFKGYVMDLSGLNSKKVTNFHRQTDGIIHYFRPHYIINHAWTHDLNLYGKNRFEIDTIFADVTLVDYPYWVIMKRSVHKHGYAKLPLNICHNMYDVLDQAQVVRFYSDSLYISVNELDGNIPFVWMGIKREENSFDVDVTLYNDTSILLKQTITIEKGDPVYISRYVKGISIPFTYKGIKATAVTIKPKGIYSFTCLGPLLEYEYE